MAAIMAIVYPCSSEDAAPREDLYLELTFTLLNTIHNTQMQGDMEMQGDISYYICFIYSLPISLRLRTDHKIQKTIQAECIRQPINNANRTRLQGWKTTQTELSKERHILQKVDYTGQCSKSKVIHMYCNLLQSYSLVKQAS